MNKSIIVFSDDGGRLSSTTGLSVDDGLEFFVNRIMDDIESTYLIDEICLKRKSLINVLISDRFDFL